MKLRKRKINILGTTYTLSKESHTHNPKLINSNAYTETLSKKIVFEVSSKNLETLENLNVLDRKVLRHEIIHAFLHESGLSTYGEDEVLTDWLALQFPKIAKVLSELGVEE